MRGGEKVIEALCELFPDADIFTHVYDPENTSSIIKKHTRSTSCINRLPKAKKYYPSYLPLMPLALEQLDLTGYDLIISSESGPSKGIISSPGALHICYCHTPMRYLWDMYHEYLLGAGVIKRWLMPPLVHYLRLWDRASADRVDHFIANSSFVAKRIAKYYRRESTVIPPPVEVASFEVSDQVDDYYLMVGQLTHYKKANLAVETFNQLNKPLVIIGEGELLPTLRKIASPNIKLLGRQNRATIRNYYSHCKALIFPGIEDFGIVPMEAMASGRPVIAFKAGGAMETVVDNVTGIFFDEQTPNSLAAAVQQYEFAIDRFCPHKIRQHAEKFDKCVFQKRILEFIHTIKL